MGPPQEFLPWQATPPGLRPSAWFYTFWSLREQVVSKKTFAWGRSFGAGLPSLGVLMSFSFFLLFLRQFFWLVNGALSFGVPPGRVVEADASSQQAGKGGTLRGSRCYWRGGSPRTLLFTQEEDLSEQGLMNHPNGLGRGGILGEEELTRWWQVALSPIVFFLRVQDLHLLSGPLT